jgi:hypothetical protein
MHLSISWCAARNEQASKECIPKQTKYCWIAAMADTGDKVNEQTVYRTIYENCIYKYLHYLTLKGYCYIYMNILKEM